MILTAENYYSEEANKEYISVSQYKTFKKCEYMGYREVMGQYKRPETTALLVGSYVDAHFEKTLDIFKAQHPEMFKKDGCLKSDFIKAEEIINRVEEDAMFRDFMSGEKQVIMTGKIGDIPVKVKIDSLCSDKIVDLKIMKDFQPIYIPAMGRMNFIEAWGYDIQGAVYQEIVRQNTGEKLPFYIASATKETVTDIGIFDVPNEVLETALLIFENDVPQFEAIKKGFIEPERCEKCDACKQTKRITHITSWEELNNYGD